MLETTEKRKENKMKRIIAIALIITALLALASCGNKAVFDTEYTFDYALASFPDGRVEKIEIKTWKDFEDGDQIQIVAEDGSVYVFHSANCVLVKEGDE